MEILESSDKYQACDRGNALISSYLKAADRFYTPDYKARKYAGDFIRPLPYEVISTELSDPVNNCYNTYYSWGNPYQNQFTSNMAKSGAGNWVVIPPISYMNGDLGAKLMGKLNRAELNSALAWFERKDTFSLIASKALTLARAARYVRKGKFSRAARELGWKLPQRTSKRVRSRDRIDQFTDNWLEFRYGWQPLMFDIYAASDIISNGLNFEGANLIKIHTSEKERVLGEVVPPSLTNSELIVDWSSTVYDRRHGMGLHFSVTDPEYRFKEALGLNNPFLVAWELVPFSFVADWFLPIGDSLAALTAYNGLSFKSGYEYWREKMKIQVGSWGWYGAINGSYGEYVPLHYDPDGGYTYARNHFKRRVVEGFRDLRIDPWKLSNGLNPVRALDALTLLQGVLRPNQKLGYSTPGLRF